MGFLKKYNKYYSFKRKLHFKCEKKEFNYKKYFGRLKKKTWSGIENREKKIIFNRNEKNILLIHYSSVIIYIHTHTHIYVYMYICVCVSVIEIIYCWWNIFSYLFKRDFKNIKTNCYLYYIYLQKIILFCCFYCCF